jgi:Rod binding domain-containing protein
MRDTVPKFDPLHSYAQDTYQEMLDREWTKNMVQQRSVGLAEMMYRQLSRLESPHSP